jgi:hypothetical protein
MVERLPADQQAAQRDRTRVAKERKGELERRAPHLTLVLPSAAPRGTVVTRDGTVIADALLGVELPIDPGDHLLVVKAPGRAERTQRIQIAEGERLRVALTYEDTALSGPSAQPPPRAQPAAPATPRREAPSRTGRTLGYAALGVGAAALAVGAVTGALTFSRAATVHAHCSDAACDLEGKDAADSGRVFGVVSTIAFGVGVVSAGTGIVLIATAPKASSRVAFGGLAGTF